MPQDYESKGGFADSEALPKGIFLGSVVGLKPLTLQQAG